MKALVKLSYKTLYLLWGAMFVLTAVLGFLFPSVEGTAKLPLQLATGAFFLPPWGILTKARLEEKEKHFVTVRNLGLTSLISTMVLMALNMMSAGMGETVGNVLNAVLTIVSAPMVCSNLYIMPLFLWGTLLMATFSNH